MLLHRQDVIVAHGHHRLLRRREGQGRRSPRRPPRPRTSTRRLGTTLVLSDASNFDTTGKFTVDGVDGTCTYGGKSGNSLTSVSRVHRPGQGRRSRHVRGQGAGHLQVERQRFDLGLADRRAVLARHDPPRRARPTATTSSSPSITSRPTASLAQAATAARSASPARSASTSSRPTRRPPSARPPPSTPTPAT